MKLILLGTTGYHPNDRRQTACLMLPELGVVLDAGTAMYRVRQHLCTDTLDIFLTHAHLDHIVGITFLFDVLWQRTMRYTRVHGEAEKLEAIERHLFAPALFPARPPFEFQALNQQVTLSDGSRLTHFPLSHPGGAVGYRIDWPDRSMAYVTDTTASKDAAYLEHIHGVDLLIHECYFADGWESQAALTGHSCLTPVAQLARAADVKRLVLVHINPMLDQEAPLDLESVRDVFPAIEVGADGQVIEF